MTTSPGVTDDRTAAINYCADIGEILSSPIRNLRWKLRQILELRLPDEAPRELTYIQALAGEFKPVPYSKFNEQHLVDILKEINGRVQDFIAGKPRSCVFKAYKLQDSARRST